MVEVVGIDHVVIRVGNFDKSKEFYDRLLVFLGFELIEAFSDTIGWRNGKTAFWIARAENPERARRPREDDVGLHHYAFELRDRSDVDALQTFLKSNDVDIVDPAGEYYEDYYAVYFLDPDGIKLEGMTYGVRHPHGARRKA